MARLGTAMSDPERDGTGMLVCGVIMVIGGALFLHSAHAAAAAHSFIPYKSGSMSPAQAYAAAGLTLAFGVLICVMWFLRRRRKTSNQAMQRTAPRSDA